MSKEKIVDSSTYRLNQYPICYDSMFEKYKEYKNGILTEPISENEEKQIVILKTLEELGYSMEETGTYFYKEVIMSLKEEMQKIHTEEDYISLMSEIGDSYSQFYFDIARNGMDIGVKTFHGCISMSYQNRIKNPINVNLAKEIGAEQYNADYRGEAVLIASHLLKKENTNTRPLVKTIGVKK